VPQSVVPEVDMATEEQKYATHNIRIELQQNSLKEEVGQFVFNYKSVLILTAITRNGLINGRSKLLYLFIRRVMKQTVLIIRACPFFQLHTKFYATSCCEG
jgi:hypothetical protein